MNRELKLFFTALSFYSRLPSPASVHKEHEVLLPDAIRYLPLVGWISGLLSAAVYIGFSYLFNPALALLFVIAANLLLTGAFHEDGFADVCDGFGGGYTKEKILLIMKDSRLGTYGVAGLTLLLAIRFSAMQQLFSGTTDFFLISGLFVVAQTLSRFSAITLVYSHSYARIEESKASGAVAKGKAVNLYIAGLLTILPLIGLTAYSSIYLGLILFPVALITFYLGNYFKRWIGGYTGDCLGAVQQLAEVVIYLSVIVIWRFI